MPRLTSPSRNFSISNWCSWVWSWLFEDLWESEVWNKCSWNTLVRGVRSQEMGQYPAKSNVQSCRWIWTQCQSHKGPVTVETRNPNPISSVIGWGLPWGFPCIHTEQGWWWEAGVQEHHYEIRGVKCRVLTKSPLAVVLKVWFPNQQHLSHVLHMQIMGTLMHAQVSELLSYRNVDMHQALILKLVLEAHWAPARPSLHHGEVKQSAPLNPNNTSPFSFPASKQARGSKSILFLI